MVFRKTNKKKIKEIEETKARADIDELETAKGKLKKAEEELKELKEEEPEETKETKLSETIKGIIVANELPTQPIRIAVGEDKKEYEIVTRDEALAEILQTMRELKEEE